MAGLSSLPETLRSLRPVRTLEANLRRGRLAHAILLKGEELQQLEQVALALAGSLLESETPARHPDLFTLRPAKKSRGIAVGSRDKDEPNTMRRLTRDLNQTSNQGGYKVAIVYEADRMNAAAANAFLKTLEEPPPRTVILLLSTRPYELMDTIRSRCFQFRIPSSGQISEDADWETWLRDYRGWIHWLHRQPDQARGRPDAAILRAYGLIVRFAVHVEKTADRVWEEQEQDLPESLPDDEIEALRIGMQKGVRDRLLIQIEETTRLAAIELSHHVPFPADRLTQAIAALESINGLLALNMKDDAAMEAFLLQSLKIWT